jgi:hypothetical protein
MEPEARNLKATTLVPVHLDTGLGTGGWKPPEPAARMAALRSAGFSACGLGHLPDARSQTRWKDRVKPGPKTAGSNFIAIKPGFIIIVSIMKAVGLQLVRGGLL